ncbi:uncharacterized protein [Parasteatoda tepidariorum]|uniref:uncharacterized protein n=1 Tax=Parasteatoda tepidariorum TaxID=114398 RepID=UPI00077FBB58|nr:uncharacterized protein LOC107442346 [Parasteatoda tepidariorum]
MFVFWSVLTACFLAAFAAEAPGGEMDSLCKNVTQSLGNDLDKCAKLDPPAVKEALTKCQTKVLPGVDTKAYPFLVAACKDRTIFQKISDCMSENAESMKDVVFDEASTKCFEGITKKYGLEDIAI